MNNLLLIQTPNTEWTYYNLRKGGHGFNIYENVIFMASHFLNIKHIWYVVYTYIHARHIPDIILWKVQLKFTRYISIINRMQ